MNATASIGATCPSNRRSSAPVFTSERMATPNRLADKARRPSGEKATPKTSPACPSKRRTSLPVSASQSRIVSSPSGKPLPERASRPSG